jgi:hypothetical protein
VQGELVLLHAFELPVFDNQFFPENYMMIYESVELSHSKCLEEIQNFAP